MVPTDNSNNKYEYKSIQDKTYYQPVITGKSLLDRNENKKIKDNHTILDFMKEFNNKKKIMNCN